MILNSETHKEENRSSAIHRELSCRMSMVFLHLKSSTRNHTSVPDTFGFKCISTLYWSMQAFPEDCSDNLASSCLIREWAKGKPRTVLWSGLGRKSQLEKSPLPLHTHTWLSWGKAESGGSQLPSESKRQSRVRGCSISRTPQFYYTISVPPRPT